MTTYKQLEEHLASPQFRRRLTYRTAERTSVSVDDVDSRQLGHMLETLTDAMIFMNRIGDDPHIDVTLNPTTHTHIPSGPAFMQEIVNDPRGASSYRRTDMPIPRLDKRAPLTVLSDDLHVMLRRQGNMMGNMFVVPDGMESLFEEYSDMIRSYKDMVKSYGDHSQVPESAKQEYTLAYQQVADRLFGALKALPSVSVIVDSAQYTIPNDKPVNPMQPDSYPAFVLFALRSIGKEGIDRNRRPPAEFRRIADIVGVESVISDTMQGLLDHIRKTAGAQCASCDIPRQQLSGILKKYVRPVQQALEFCRIADCGYKTLYDDLALFARMAGEEPVMGPPQDAMEVALLLYAVDRRFAREDTGDAQARILNEYAQKASQYAQLDQLVADMSQDMELQRALMASRQIAAEKGFGSVVAAIDQLQSVLRIEQSAAQRLDAQRDRNQRAAGQGNSIS
jgi:hypothetical protein